MRSGPKPALPDAEHCLTEHQVLKKTLALYASTLKRDMVPRTRPIRDQIAKLLEHSQDIGLASERDALLQSA